MVLMDFAVKNFHLDFRRTGCVFLFETFASISETLCGVIVQSDDLWFLFSYSGFKSWINQLMKHASMAHFDSNVFDT